jgi:hypothetical protein
MNLCPSDLEHFRGNRALRRGRLPKGYRNVDRVEVAPAEQDPALLHLARAAMLSSERAFMTASSNTPKSPDGRSRHEVWK